MLWNAAGTCQRGPAGRRENRRPPCAGTAETYFVGKDSWPAGKTLGALNLRGRTGATVVAVVRGDQSFTSPGAEFEVREQDTLILVASHRDIDRAFR